MQIPTLFIFIERKSSLCLCSPQPGSHHITVQHNWKTSGQKLEAGLTVLFSVGMLSRMNECLLAHSILHTKNQQGKLCTYKTKRGTPSLQPAEQGGHSFLPALVWHDNLLEVNPLETVLA